MLFRLHRTHTPFCRNGALALSPLPVMAALFLVLSAVFGGFSKVPLLVVFIVTSAYALLTLRGLPFEERLAVFSRGAGQNNLLLMVWIFILAGAFAATAKEMGAVEATVALCLKLLPSPLLLPGLFAAACVVSMCIGTSVGTIAALVPIAVGLSPTSGLGVPLTVAACVGGAFFGDNLSFISDTTVAATRTQGCRMSDKFRTNMRIALPAALVTTVLYTAIGWGAEGTAHGGAVSLWKILPYAVVLATAVSGLNVILVLSAGLLLTGITGMAIGSYTLAGWLTCICTGVGSMSELILISMMAGGLLAVIRKGGGIDLIVKLLTRRVNSVRGAELSIAALVGLTNLCTANNTVAILSVGPIARDVSERFSIASRRVASILDTVSCVVQGLIPYGAQLLIAAGLAAVEPTAIIPFLYYPPVLGVCLLAGIATRRR